MISARKYKMSDVELEMCYSLILMRPVCLGSSVNGFPQTNLGFIHLQTQVTKCPTFLPNTLSRMPIYPKVSSINLPPPSLPPFRALRNVSDVNHPVPKSVAVANACAQLA